MSTKDVLNPLRRVLRRGIRSQTSRRIADRLPPALIPHLLRLSRIAGTGDPNVAYRDSVEATIRLLRSERVPRQEHLRDLDALREVASASRGVVVYPPTIAWGYLFQRPQQIMRELAKQGYTVVFCTPQPHVDSVDGFREVAKRLFLCSDARLTRNLEVDILWINWTRNAPYRLLHPAAKVVYEFIDELEVFDLYCDEMERDHCELLSTCEVVVASADDLHAQIASLRPDAVLAPNGVDSSDFEPIPEEAPPADLVPALQRRTPVVGYYGALARWFDFELFNAVSLACSDLTFVLIGPDFDGSLSRLQRRDNVFHLPPKPYRSLIRYSSHFDVACIPFRVSQLTHSTSPVKLFEFFAAGLPVVTTPMRECTKYPVMTAGTAAEWSTALRSAVTQRSADEDAARRLVADANSWARRVETILEAL